MEFPTKIAGVPCFCRVLAYSAEIPAVMRGFGDSEPGEEEEFEFEILDRKGYRATWLERKISPSTIPRLKREYLKFLEEEAQPL